MPFYCGWGRGGGWVGVLTDLLINHWFFCWMFFVVALHILLWIAEGSRICLRTPTYFLPWKYTYYILNRLSKRLCKCVGLNYERKKEKKQTRNNRCHVFVESVFNISSVWIELLRRGSNPRQDKCINNPGDFFFLLWRFVNSDVKFLIRFDKRSGKGWMVCGCFHKHSAK